MESSNIRSYIIIIVIDHSTRNINFTLMVTDGTNMYMAFADKTSYILFVYQVRQQDSEIPLPCVPQEMQSQPIGVSLLEKHIQLQ